MSYSFDVLGITPIFTFFNYQQEVEQNPRRNTAYLGSYHCSLEGFIQATELIHQKPDWDWDDVVKRIIDFWLGHEENIQQWKRELTTIGQESLIVARVANIDGLRKDFEVLL
jgi:hypothetical protein